MKQCVNKLKNCKCFSGKRRQIGVSVDREETQDVPGWDSSDSSVSQSINQAIIKKQYLACGKLKKY